MNNGHVKVSVTSNAFDIVVTDRPRESKCEGKAGFRAGFLEKSKAEWWNKFVCLINDI